jgi:hypothetical protein
MTGYQSKKLMAQSREDDLVKRLNDEINATYGKHPCGLLNEAVYRIEEQQDEITYLRAFARKARAALGEKKDG